MHPGQDTMLYPGERPLSFTIRGFLVAVQHVSDNFDIRHDFLTFSVSIRDKTPEVGSHQRTLVWTVFDGLTHGAFRTNISISGSANP